MRYPKNVTFCAEGGRSAARARLRSPSGYRVDRERDGVQHRPPVKRRCTLLAVWYVEQEEPWIILTDLPPDEVGVSWYALRFWIELGFKAVKSLGWQWQKTRRTDPARISRHWFVLSVATLLTLAYGTRVEDAYDRRLAPGSLRAAQVRWRPITAVAGRSRDGPSCVIRYGIAGFGGCNRGRFPWLLPEPWPEPKSVLEVPAMPLHDPIRG